MQPNFCANGYRRAHTLGTLATTSYTYLDWVKSLTDLLERCMNSFSSFELMRWWPPKNKKLSFYQKETLRIGRLKKNNECWVHTYLLPHLNALLSFQLHRPSASAFSRKIQFTNSDGGEVSDSNSFCNCQIPLNSLLM